MTNPRQLAPTMGLSHDGFEFLKGSFDGLKGYAVGRMTRSRRDKLYIDNAGWGTEADSIEYGYRVPFGGIHVFIGKIGEPAPEPDICTDIIETAQHASPSPVQPVAKHVFVGIIHGAEYEDGPASDGETVVCSDDESSGKTESLYQLQDGWISGGSEGNSIPDSPDLPNRAAIFMAGTQSAPHSLAATAILSGSTTATPAGGSKLCAASGSSPF